MLQQAEYQPIVMLRIKQVVERTGLSRSTIYSKIDPKSAHYDPSFPRQVRLGNGAVAWVEAEIDDWLRKCIQHREIEMNK